MKSDRIKIEKALIFAVLFTVLAFLSLECASAADIYVPDNHTRIQWAIDNATAGDTIIVKSGTYYENVNVYKQLILIGVDTGTGKPVVDAGGLGNAITLSADGIALDGFTATNSGSSWQKDAGIKVNSHSNTITGNNASNNNYYGISLYNSSKNTLRNNLMSGNRYNFGARFEFYSDIDNDIDTSNLVDGKPIYYLVGASGTVIDLSANAGTVYCVNCENVIVEDLNLTSNYYGIYFYNTSNSRIQNNYIRNNNGGIFLDSSSNNTITGNNACNNRYGISLSHSSSNTITGNNACNNDRGIYFYSSSNNTITGNTASNNYYSCIFLYNSSNNTITGNNAYNNNWYGISLSHSSSNTITGNNACNNRYGISLYNSSKNTLRNNLMSGNRYNFGARFEFYSDVDNDIDTSNLVDGKPIYYLVGASGTVIDLSSNAGTVYCVNCENVIVKDLNLTSNYYGIYFYNTSNSRIQNNYIRNNNGGIFLDSSSNNNTITGNNARNNGFGIHLELSSNNTITGNTASNNKYTGICLDSSSNNTITGNTASNNNGGGIHLDSSSSNIITGNNAGNNNGGGIHLDSSSSNTITGNTANNNYYGISLYNSSKNTLRNNLMSGNRYNFGARFEFYSDVDNDIDTSNLVDGKPIYYLVGASGTVIDVSSNAGTVYCVNCENVIVKDLNLTSNYYGIYFYNTSNSRIQNNYIRNNNGGIFLYESCSNTITGNNASTNERGISLDYSSNNIITGNNASTNERGISLDYSSKNTLRNNLMSGNRYNFGARVKFYSDIDNDIDTSNLVDGKPIYYLVGASGTVIDLSSNAGTVYCVNCENVIVKDLNLTNNLYGIYFYNTSNSRIQNNYIRNNYEGIFLSYSSNNNTITGNNVSTNNNGIYLSYSSNNNTITGNNACNNYYGISLNYPSSNKIYLNNFIDNTDNVYSSSSSNIWNSTEKKMYVYKKATHTSYTGNYWSDYFGTDADGDGIGDTPYSIDGDKDSYPLMEPFENYFAPTGTIFNTEPSENPYPSIMGTHRGEIKPSYNITVSKLYTYACVGTKGHTESIKLEENDTLIASGAWDGYQDDYQNITITPSVTLLAGHTYNYTIVTGSYPQIIHELSKNVSGGTITCTAFVDANGKTYTDWIPAIRLE